MAGSISQAATFPSQVRVAERAESVPAIKWYVWCLAAAATSAMFGGYWDISWHISIGRDTFWTPAHMAIYLAGVLAGISCGYAILATTFGSSADARAASVNVLGLRGPLGCFVAAWGGGAMLTSAPFDNWWHNAYGLDVKILSLPHSILSTGIGMISLGAFLLICAEANRASGANRAKLDRLLLYMGGVQVIQDATFSLEHSWAGLMHSSVFYFSAAASFPLMLIAITRISQSRWAATIIASIYMAAYMLALWIFPLFPAEPKLGPVFQHITHMVPLGFPTLLIFPALGIDLIRHRLGDRWRDWKSAALGGCVFLAVLIAVQWPFAIFLNSPMARNRVFGRIYFGYSDPANIRYNPYQFFYPDKAHGAFATGMVEAFIAAMILSMIGMALGNWLRRLKR